MNPRDLLSFEMANPRLKRQSRSGCISLVKEARFDAGTSGLCFFYFENLLISFYLSKFIYFKGILVVLELD